MARTEAKKKKDKRRWALQDARRAARPKKVVINKRIGGEEETQSDIQSRPTQNTP